MITRFKSAILNAVSNTGLDASVVGIGANSSNEEHIPSSTERSSSKKYSRSSSHEVNGVEGRARKYDYGRPHFLQLSTADEITVTADHVVRPIIVPRDISCLPWETGYAETINSGKSKLNEDQARSHHGLIKGDIFISSETETSGDASEGSINVSTRQVSIPYYYYGLFDGHAGAGAAVAAAADLHKVLHNKLQEIGHHLVQEGPFCESIGSKGKSKGVYWYPQISVTKDSLIVGALESAFYEMDESIRVDNLRYDGVNGGCTAIVCLFILGKVYTANAGDSRTIYCMRNADPVPLSQDFTPETERTRVRQLAYQRPELLGTDFTSNEYLRRPVRKDIGSSILYRAAHMTGWAYKIATAEDLKFPVVFGHGKRSRVLATIGVTRGFGDHELYAHNSSTKIKPFLSSQPEVKILDLTDNLDEDSVIVMGTDGLWDVAGNSIVSRIVFSTLDQFPRSDANRYKYRYVSAAQDLVMHARGKFIDKSWKMSDESAATIDDISVFVIPIGPYRREWVNASFMSYSPEEGDRENGNISESHDSFETQERNGESETSHEVAVDVLEQVLHSVELQNEPVNLNELEEPNH